MAQTVFFSWQSDRAAKVCKNLIEGALKLAIADLAADLEVQDAIRPGDLELDKDTQGVAGSPPIVETIFRKIDDAKMFVADLTSAGARVNGDPTPNPNVLIEYGWALKQHSHSRLIAVMNIAFGSPDPTKLPFDLRHLRGPIRYNCPADADSKTRKQAQAGLAKDLQSAIKAILKSPDFLSPSPAAPEPELYEPIPPKEGKGRFRASGERIGVEQIVSVLQLQNPTDIHLCPGPAAWLRVFPRAMQARSWNVTDLERAATRSEKYLTPMGNGNRSLSSVRGEDGFGIFEKYPGDERTPSIVFAFEQGEVWAIDTHSVRDDSRFQGQIAFDEAQFAHALQIYIDFLRRLGVEGPLLWQAGMEGIKNKFFEFRTLRGHRKSTLCLRDDVVVNGEVRDENSTMLTLKPFFEEVFNRFGATRPAEADEVIVR